MLDAVQNVQCCSVVLCYAYCAVCGVYPCKYLVSDGGDETLAAIPLKKRQAGFKSNGGIQQNATLSCVGNTCFDEFQCSL